MSCGRDCSQYIVEAYGKAFGARCVEQAQEMSQGYLEAILCILCYLKKSDKTRKKFIP